VQNILRNYLLRRWLFPLLGALLFYGGMLMAYEVVGVTKEIFSIGAPFRWVGPLLLLAVPENLGMVLPMAAVLGGLMGTQHLAEGSDLIPRDAYARARMLEWLFWEQYSHEPYIAVARWLITYRGQKQAQAERLKLCAERGRKALGIMEQRLASHDWLTDAGPTIADLALFAYTHVADEGEFDLAETPAVAAWVKRLAALPGITTLPRPPGFAAI